MAAFRARCPPKRLNNAQPWRLRQVYKFAEHIMATATDTLISRRDIDFLVFDWLRIEELFATPRFSIHDRSTIEATIDLFETLAATEFAPHNRKNDEIEPQLIDGRVVLNPEVATSTGAFRDAGLMAATQEENLGGMNLPTTIDQVGMAFMFAANPGSAGYPFLAKAHANLLIEHGSAELIELYARRILDGEAFGTMCLSEPHAGSNLADIRTRAVPLDDGRYRLFGNKMWISAADHELTPNIFHAVLAKIPHEDGQLPASTRGISLFLVPKRLLDADGAPGDRNDVSIAGINHKLGYRGTVNCALNFGEGAYRPEGEAGAIGYIIGPPGQGLNQMFHMMNEARIGVGMGAAAMAYTGYLHALGYAKERPQGRLPSQRSRKEQVAIIEHADVRRMLLTAKCYAEGALSLVLLCSRLFDDTRSKGNVHGDEAKILLDLLTPVAKSWPSQWGLAANDLAIQIYGGAGYTRDYPVEQFYRDNRLNPIHEGTHGIQAIDLLGRKLTQHGGKGLNILGMRITETASRSTQSASFAELGRQLLTAWESVRAAADALLNEADVDRRLANASPFLEAFGHVVVAWIWLDQALLAEQLSSVAGADLAFLSGKQQACRFFFGWELPRLNAWLGVLKPIETSAYEMKTAWF